MKISVIASIGGSLVLGIAALLVAKFWLPATQDTTAQAAPPQAAVNMSPVVVATSALAYGDRLEAGKLTVRSIPRDAVPEGAFASVDEVLARDDGNPLVLYPIAEREVVLPAKISGPGSRPSVATQITDGMRAYAVAVNGDTGVGGNVLPGDWVDVVLSRETNEERQDKGLVSEVVLQNVRVLGLDTNSDPTSTKASVSNTATLEVSIQDAQKLAVAAQLGRLSLALRRTGSAETASAHPIRATDVSTVGGGASRPSAPTAPSSPAPAPSSSGHQIVIVSGGQESRVSVPLDQGVRR